MLEIRIKRMCRTPPYNRVQIRERLVSELRAFQIPRLDTEPALASKRPNVPLNELTGGRIGHLLALVDRWIDDIRDHAAEPEADEETGDQAQRWNG